VIRVGTKKLDLWSEVVGYLRGVEAIGNSLYVEIGEYLIEVERLPGLEERLRKYVGRRIGLLHTDIQGKEYLVRIAENDEKNRKKEHLLARRWQ